MSSVTYTSTDGLDLQGTEVGAWLAETTAGAATGAGASNDLSATGIDLDATGTLTKSAVNTGAGLMQFTGWSTSNYLSRAYGAGLDITDQITLMAWIKPASLSASGICGNYNDGSGDIGGSMLYYNSSGAVVFYVITNGSVQVSATDPVTLNFNEWVFIVGTMTTAGLLSLYKDGVLVGSSTGGVIGATNNTFKVGVYSSGGAAVGWFPGSIVGVKVIHGVLTAAQILEIYNNEKTLFKSNAPYRAVGTEYSLDLDVSRLDHSEMPDVTKTQSLSGNQETIYMRNDEFWDVTATNLVGADLPTMRNFIRSVKSGESFTFDAYGTIAVPDDPVTVIADPGLNEQRQSNSDYFNIPFRVRVT